jgi:hypothetical protein
MRYAHMRGGQRQPPWLLQPRQGFAEGESGARQAPVVCAPAAMITLDTTAVAGRARRRGRQQCRDRLPRTQDHGQRPLHAASSGAALDHLGRPEGRPRPPPGGRVAPPFPLAFRLRPWAIRRAQCLCVRGQLIAGAEGQRRLRDRHDAPAQPLGVFLRTLADDKGSDQAPGWSKGPPPQRQNFRPAAAPSAEGTPWGGHHATGPPIGRRSRGEAARGPTPPADTAGRHDSTTRRRSLCHLAHAELARG